MLAKKWLFNFFFLIFFLPKAFFFQLFLLWLVEYPTPSATSYRMCLFYEKSLYIGLCLTNVNGVHKKTRSNLCEPNTECAHTGCLHECVQTVVKTSYHVSQETITLSKWTKYELKIGLTYFMYITHLHNKETIINIFPLHDM